MHPELASSRALDRRPDRRHLLAIRERLRLGTRRVQPLRRVRGLEDQVAAETDLVG